MNASAANHLERVVAVVVTFNRKNVLETCLVRLKQQDLAPSEVIVVDNASSDGTYEYVREAFPWVRVVRLRENLGGSGGFENGVRAALESNSDWIWLMDDDAWPLWGCLRSMIEGVRALETSGVRVGAAVPIIVPYGSVTRRGTSDSAPIEHGMFVGFLVKTSVVQAVGLPRGDFFIYYDDTEYSERIRASGYALYRINNAFIEHTEWSQRARIAVTFGSRTVSRPRVSPWRAYYLWRNRLLLERARRTGVRSYPKVAREFLVESMVRILGHDMQTVPYMIRGVWDGLRGRSGKVMAP